MLLQKAHKNHQREGGVDVNLLEDELLEEAFKYIPLPQNTWKLKYM